MTSSSNKRRGLGRGLGALIVDTSSPQSPSAARSTGVQHCPIDQISPNPHQPRAHFDEEALQELAASIKTHGIIQPLVVTENLNTAGAYWLIAGNAVGVQHSEQG
ncbi:MAG: ParB N-terminal domain-containing protein [Caldilineaceae bacterium]